MKASTKDSIFAIHDHTLSTAETNFLLENTTVIGQDPDSNPQPFALTDPLCIVLIFFQPGRDFLFLCLVSVSRFFVSCFLFLLLCLCLCSDALTHISLATRVLLTMPARKLLSQE